MACYLQIDIDALNKAQLNGEKQRVLNKISKNLKELKYSTSELDSYLKAGWKQERFNKMLYIDFAEHKKANDIVINILKSDDDQLIWYAIKKCSFVWADQKYSLEFYLTEIFPFISYENRLKLLKEIARNTNDGKRAEEFYNELSTSYGMTMARPFLERCTSTFLLEKLNCDIILSSTELRHFLPGDPDFIIDYLSEVLRLSENKEVSFSRATLQKYKNLLQKLLSRYHTKMLPDKVNLCQDNSLGRKLSKRLLTSPLKTIFIEDSELCRNLIPTRMIYKYFTKEEYGKFYRTLYPKKYDGFYGCIREYLDYYKNKEDQLQLLFTTYKSVYGAELLDNLDIENDSLLTFLDTKRRVQLAERLIEKNKEDENKVDSWTCYLTCDVSIPKFKKKIYATSDGTKRQNYLCLMLSSCKINDDMSALAEVLIYYNQRHRNEQKEVTRAFVYAIPDNVTKFDDRHWQEIDKLIDIIAINNDFNSLSNSKHLLAGLISWNVSKKLPTKKSVTNYIKWNNRSKWSTPEWDVFQNNSKVLLQIGELLPEQWPQIPERNMPTFLSALSSWNKSNPNDCLSVMGFPWLVKYVTQIFDKNKRIDMEKTYDNLQYDKPALEYFSEKIEKLKLNLKHLKTTIDTDKQLVLKNMKAICEEVLEVKHPNRLFYPLLKTHQLKSVDGFEEYIKNYCLNIVNTEITEQDPNKLKPAAMRLLLYWLQPEEFYSIARLYYPTQKEADLAGDAAATTYNFQKFIANGIKCFKDHPETFEAIKRFCIGDYLKLSVGSLKSVCTRRSLSKVDAFLDSLINSPVSFKKHIIRMKFILHNKAARISFLQNLWILEKNRSIREIILKFTIDLFSTDPDSMVWNLIKTWIESTLADDFYIADVLCRFDNIPKSYFSEYIQICWSTLNKLEPDNSNVQSGKVSTIRAIENNLTRVSPQVVDIILKENLFNSDNEYSFVYPLCSLASKYVLQNNGTEHDQVSRIEFCVSIIKEHCDSNWNTIHTDKRYSVEYPSFPIRTRLNYILDQMFNYYRYNEETSSNVLAKFLNKLNEMFDTTNFILKPYLKLELMLQFRILKKNNVEFGKYLRALIDKYVQLHGTFIIHSIAESITESFAMSQEFKYIEMAETLLSEPAQSAAYALLVLDCVPFNTLYQTSNKHILDKLNKIDDINVKMMIGNSYQ